LCGRVAAVQALRIVLSYHGDKRLRERGISNADIQDVVARPTLKVNRNDGCVEYVRTTRSDRRLKVVLDETQDPALLVTAFW